MKHNSIIAIVLAAICPLAVYAGDDAKLVPLKGSPNPSIPTRPHDLYEPVQCWYEARVISLYFETSEGMATVTITILFTRTTASWYVSTALQPATIVMGSEPGTYSIEITTSESTYDGVFTID